MANQRSSREWSEILRSYAQKDGTQKKFCQQHGIRPCSLQYHLRKAKRQDASEICKASPESRLIELHAPPVPSPSVDRREACHRQEMQIEYQHDVLGPLKINCSSDQLAMIVKQLASTLTSSPL